MSTEIEIVGYLRASQEGQPEWSEDCVCEDAVYPNYDGDESVSIPICRLADAEAEIAQRDARIAELEAERARWEHLAQKAWDKSNVEFAADIATAIDAVDEQAAFEVAWPSIAAELPSRLRIRYSAGDVHAAEREAALEGWRVARLNPCRAQAVPDGYALVPVEPTAEMLERAAFAESCGRPVSPRINRMYDAMLAAAPSSKKES